MQQPPETLPRHIGIIMDGNGRWAKKRGLPRTAGHRQGAKRVEEIARYCRQLGIGVLTLYAFSTENWARPAEEVDAIMDLLRDYLRQSQNHAQENVRTRFIGERAPLAPDIQRQMEQLEQQSAGCTGMVLNIAVNYGARQEIARAAAQLAQQVALGQLEVQQIGPAQLDACLYTAGQPDPDLIIRPSGEKRLSNFLLWQAAYAELVYMDVLWPDFSPAHLDSALAEYATRTRRFGGI